MDLLQKLGISWRKTKHFKYLFQSSRLVKVKSMLLKSLIIFCTVSMKNNIAVGELEMVKRKVGKIRDRNLARMMKRMGLNMNELSDVTEVIIRLTDKELVLEKPQVIKMSVGGQDVFQITGIVEERELASEESSVTIELSEEDIQLVASQANVSLEEARAALEQTNGDLAQAIMLLKQRGI